MMEDLFPKKKINEITSKLKNEMGSESKLGKVTRKLGADAKNVAKKTGEIAKETVNFAKDRITGKKGVPIELLLFLL